MAGSSTSIDVTTLIETLINKLDEAGDYLETAQNIERSPEETKDLKNGLLQLKTTRSLLIMVDSEDKFKTLDMLAAIPSLAKPLNALVTDLKKGKPNSIRRVDNSVISLKGKTDQLFSKLPGLVVMAMNNEQGKDNEIMLNAPWAKDFFKTMQSKGGGGTFIANGNTANGRFMLNAPIDTDMDLGKLLLQKWEESKK